MGARGQVWGVSGSTARGGRHRPGAFVLLALGACLLAALLVGAATARAAAGHPGGAQVTSPQSDKVLLTFSFQGLSPAAVGTIDEAAHTVAVTVPTGTDVRALVATFTYSGQVVTVPPSDVKEDSGVTPHDFTNPVTYRVTAFDTLTQDYVVTVTVGTPPPPPPPPSSAKEITAFSFDEFDPAIVGVFNLDHISATVPNDTDTSDLVATFATTGVSVKVNGVEQVSGETANDFTGDVTYVVTAADATIQLYVVTVKTAPASKVLSRVKYRKRGTRHLLISTSLLHAWPYQNVRLLTQSYLRPLAGRAGVAAKRWVKVKGITHKTNAHGVVRWKLKLPGEGTYRLRASVRKNATHPAYKTKWVKVRVE